jgi:hypothetical protein
VLVVKLAALGYLFGLTALVLSWSYYSALTTVSSTIFNQGFSLALLVWVYYKIYVGRNWARILLLILTVLGMLMLSSRIFRGILFAAPAIAVLSTLVSTGITGVNLWLLFISPGRRWFKKRESCALAAE